MRWCTQPDPPGGGGPGGGTPPTGGLPGGPPPVQDLTAALHAAFAASTIARTALSTTAANQRGGSQRLGDGIDVDINSAFDDIVGRITDSNTKIDEDPGNDDKGRPWPAPDPNGGKKPPTEEDESARKCLEGGKSWIRNGALDSSGRATLGEACYANGHIPQKGQYASKRTPVGWQAGSGMARGHLIGRALGGSNADENIVPLYQVTANKPMYDRIEADVRKRLLKNHETVYYRVVPIYGPDSDVPTRLDIFYVSSADGEHHCYVKNSPTTKDVDCDR
ncbi:DNA/RNA non-specific endonuclease [Actinocatenispora rupis]|uniref:DNA/RNA non-specific endonuclease n=1 Tax=Actinocatenispora rupis TaxID=519421 RepID=UPI0031E4F2F6